MIDPLNITASAPVVELNGKDLAELGIGIYPQAFALLDHKSTYMRIIGASALNSICGLKAEWSYLQSPWDSNGAQTDWALEAKRIWSSWYAERLASEIQWTKKKAEQSTEQPATHSQSKSEGSDNPQPEAEGRSR